MISVLLVTLARTGLCAGIGEAKALPDGTPVAISGSLTLAEPVDCYVEAIDRSAGIWVQAATTWLTVGDFVTATGTMGTVNGERVVQNAILLRIGGSALLLPLSLQNAWLGGSSHVGSAALQDFVTYPSGASYRWHTTGGAPNTGLLAKTCGTVNAVYYSPITTTHWFYIDDGSGVVSDFGDQGVIVYSDADVGQGDIVTVTGVSSIEVALDNSARLVRSIRPRSTSDVQVVQRATFVPVSPFSDEFDSPLLDPRWITVGDVSKLSLTANPGWLTLYADSTTLGYGPAIFQQLSGDWDLEIKVRPQFNDLLTAAAFGVMLNPWVVYLGTQIAAVSCENGTTTVYLPNSSISTLNSDIYWFRLRMRSWTLYGSVSIDGMSYSAESSVSLVYPYLEIRATTRGPAYRPAIDYVRFTRCGQ